MRGELQSEARSEFRSLQTGSQICHARNDEAAATPNGIIAHITYTRRLKVKMKIHLKRTLLQAMQEQISYIDEEVASSNVRLQ
jgi:hypothetical protein